MPVEHLTPNENQVTPQQIHAYQWKVGSINYAATITRPDIARAASNLSEFMQNPSPHHQEVADQVIAYLNGTRSYAIQYSDVIDEDTFAVSSDAAYADDLTTRRSTEGYLFKLFGGPIDWRSTKQKTVTTSTTEAELLALTAVAKETQFWKRFFSTIYLDLDHDISIACDNQQTLGLLDKESPLLSTKLRHINIHNHWLRQEVQQGRIKTQWIPTAEMPADGLTKSLPRQRHEKFVQQLGLVDISDRLKSISIN